MSGATPEWYRRLDEFSLRAILEATELLGAKETDERAPLCGPISPSVPGGTFHVGCVNRGGHRLFLVRSLADLPSVGESTTATLRRRIRSLENLAYRDRLTGLFNRAGFELAGRTLLRQSDANGQPLLVMMLDMDNLKTINDTFGHAEGDQALKATGDVLAGVLRSTDVLGRLGGDEFAAILVCWSDFETPTDAPAPGRRDPSVQRERERGLPALS